MLNIGNSTLLDYAEIKHHERENADIAAIADNTVNTWQPWRKETEKYADTTLGKLAEDAVMTLFAKLSIAGYYPYDSFRTDGFKLHAPLDGIFSANFPRKLIDLINEDVQRSEGRLSVATREAIRAANAYSVEIKSTRLAEKYKTRAGFTSYNDAASVRSLVGYLMNLDFLCYPHFVRCGDMTYDQYCLFAEKRLNTHLPLNELKEKVRENELLHAYDILIRVFMDEENKKAIVMGWIDRFRFFSSPILRKLPSKNKSENALYFVKPLKYGFPLRDLGKLFE